MYIDTHVHLQFPQFHEDRPMVIGNAKKAGVKKFICPGVDPLSSKLAVELAQTHPDVIFASIGYHPYEAQHIQHISQLESLLKTITQNGQTIVAIGECGLDYHLYKGEDAAGKKQAQRMLFEEQLRLALKHNLPVIMHCRDAFDDFFTVLDDMPSMPRGVIHCFSGGLHHLDMAKKRNLYVGIDGNITYSKQLQTVAASIPLSMLLLETDSPYLTPVPHRGQRNEPKYIPLIAKQIALLTSTQSAEIETQTTHNAQNLFGMRLS